MDSGASFALQGDEPDERGPDSAIHFARNQKKVYRSDVKSNRIISLLALVSASRLVAGDYTDTNQMPAPIHALMETAGFALGRTNLDLPPAGTNSLRQLPVIEKAQLIRLEVPATKTGWSLWNHSNVKYVGKNIDPINVFAPTSFSLYTALSQFEYDVSYTFEF